jgi:hypothetical protein
MQMDHGAGDLIKGFQTIKADPGIASAPGQLTTPSPELKEEADR